MTTASPTVSTLVATVVTTVSLSCHAASVDLIHDSGSDPVYYTTDGSTPAVATTGSYTLLPGGVVRHVPIADETAPVIKLVSAGTPTVTVQKSDRRVTTPGGGAEVSGVTIVPGTGASNLGKAEDGASADGDVGVGLLAVRKATPANTSGTDGDYEFLQMSTGRLWVDASGKTLTVDGSGVTQPVSSATLATAAKQPALGTAGSSSTDVISVQGIASGTNLNVAVASAVPGTGATALGKAEDAAHSSGDTGVMMLAVRESTATDLSAGGTNGDYEPLQVDASGQLWVNAGAVTPGTAAGNLGKAEDAAHVSGDTGVMMLAVRKATATDLSAGATDGDYEPLQVDANGCLHVTARTLTQATATLANVSGSASSVTLLASNSAARGRVVTNDSSSALYLKFGATASTTSYTVKIAAAGYYEFPGPLYTGIVDGIWDSATGSARTTEW